MAHRAGTVSPWTGVTSVHIAGSSWFQMEPLWMLSALNFALSLSVYSCWDPGDTNRNKNAVFKEVPQSWTAQPHAAAATATLHPELWEAFPLWSRSWSNCTEFLQSHQWVVMGSWFNFSSHLAFISGLFFVGLAQHHQRKRKKEDTGWRTPSSRAHRPPAAVSDGGLWEWAAGEPAVGAGLGLAGRCPRPCTALRGGGGPRNLPGRARRASVQTAQTYRRPTGAGRQNTRQK